ncbi:hypothetical protein ACU686_14335 [Yinghuangia aomiensis]
MFFVAESISQLYGEFRAAVTAFASAPKPGAPFAAAFVENSEGYAVAGKRFPAVAVTRAMVRDALVGMTDGLTVERIEPIGEKFRDGYTGLLLGCGPRCRPLRSRCADGSSGAVRG